jgi:hypothetical protein
MTVLMDYGAPSLSSVTSGRKVIYIGGFDFSYDLQIRMWPRPMTARELQRMPEAFRDSDGWRRVPVVVCDGGPHYFGAVYDPAAQSVVLFGFNGY